MRICITGASGLIGKELVRSICKSGEHEVVAVQRKRRCAPHHSVELFEADLRDFNRCVEVVAQIDAVVHLAWNSVPLAEGPSSIFDLNENLIPILNLLEAIKLSKRRPKFILFSSGGTVYGNNPRRIPSIETDACSPTNMYAALKVAAESVCQSFAYADHISLTVLRVSTVYGQLLPRTAKQGFIGTALSSALERQPIRLIGDPNNVRDYVHINDVVSATISALSKNLGRPEVFNIGSGCGRSVEEILCVINNALGREVKTFVENNIYAKSLVDWSVLDINKAKMLLDWSPSTNLNDAIKAMSERPIVKTL